MAKKYIVCHRRGTAVQWAEADIIPKSGELVIEIDETNNLHKLKIGDGVHRYSELAYLMTGDEIVTQVLTQTLPQIITITLDVNKWKKVTYGSDSNFSYYGQQIAIDGITEYSMLDLQPSADMLAEFQNLKLAFVTENKDAVITVYSIGEKPTKSYTMQATVVETHINTDRDSIISSAISVSAIQADYSQTDETKGDYIKNKPELGALAFKSVVEQSDINPDVFDTNIVNILPYAAEDRIIKDNSGAYLEFYSNNGSYIVGAQEGKIVSGSTTLFCIEIDKSKLPVGLNENSKLKIMVSYIRQDIAIAGKLEVNEDTYDGLSVHLPVGTHSCKYEIDLSQYRKIKLGFSVKSGVNEQISGTIQVLAEVNHQIICEDINQNLNLISANTTSFKELKDELQLEKHTKENLIKEKICRINDITSDKKIDIALFNEEACTIQVSGKNLANMGSKYYIDRKEMTNGITWQVMQDGSFKVSGTATADEFAMSEPIYLVAGIYTLTGFVNVSGATEKSALKIYTYNVENDTIGSTIVALTDSESRAFTLDSDTTIVLQIEWEQGVNYDNMVLKPQIELGVSPSSYESWRKNYTITVNDVSANIVGYYPTTTLMITQGDNLIHWVNYLQKFESSLIDKIYPIGSIYLSMFSTNPSDHFGFGTWQLIGTNRMLIGAGGKYEAGTTGGSETVTLTTTQVPKVEGRISIHNGFTATNVHQVDGCFSAGITNEKYILEGSGTTGATSVGQIRFSNGGTGAAHDNMPPYLAVYMWQRIV